MDLNICDYTNYTSELANELSALSHAPLPATLDPLFMAQLEAIRTGAPPPESAHEVLEFLRLLPDGDFTVLASLPTWYLTTGDLYPAPTDAPAAAPEDVARLIKTSVRPSAAELYLRYGACGALLRRLPYHPSTHDAAAAAALAALRCTNDVARMTAGATCAASLLANMPARAPLLTTDAVTTFITAANTVASSLRPAAPAAPAAAAPAATPVVSLHELAYTVLRCLWYVSAPVNGAPVLALDLGAARAVVSILRANELPREKLARIGASVLERLCLVPGAAARAVSDGLDRVVAGLASHQWKDEDLNVSLGALAEVLTTEEERALSWQSYVDELSTKLLPTPKHYDERFWRRCGVRFLDNNSSALRSLLALLTKADVTSGELVIALSDITHFTRYYPTALAAMRAVDADFVRGVFTLLESKDGAVARAAVQTSQAILTGVVRTN